MYSGILPPGDLTGAVAICLEPQYIHVSASHLPTQIMEHQTRLHIKKAFISCRKHFGKGQAGVL